MTDRSAEERHLAAVLGGMSEGPKSLERFLGFHAEDFLDSSLTIDNVVDHLTRNTQSEIKKLFRQWIFAWDYEKENDWSEDTQRNTLERRALILEKLGIGDFFDELNAEYRVAVEHPPVVISEDHEIWYPRMVLPFYWDRYKDHLREKRGFEETAIISLDDATNQIISRLSDPQREDAFQAKGLVVGYVQSGKTANFTGLIAKAIDSGYRMIIVLSGMMDLLRDQTQRRLDMELVGKEQVLSDRPPDGAHEYSEDPDWDEIFVEYGGPPREQGGSRIFRLTEAKTDFKLLKAGVDKILDIETLERQDEYEPINHVSNLEKSSVRLVVVKKNAAVLKKLLQNISGLSETVRDQVPALIIDDESDQASLNAQRRSQRSKASEEKNRTAINSLVTEILGLMKRCQYIGYTATPFANVLVDPDDEADIFPKDFIISLSKPPGYMGVSDFHDLSEEPPDSFELTNKEAYIRGIAQLPGEDTEKLQEAIDMFVLTGAVKLFREDKGVEGDYRHHTMLAHESVKKADHEELAERILGVWNRSGYDGGDGMNRLKNLFEEDLKPVMRDRGKDLISPKKFEDLRLFIGKTVDRVDPNNGDSEPPVLIINSDNAKDADFDTSPIWKIVIGGHKLSRGYTVEGLTISWFRRRSTFQDTVMQMGRWFGFRRGYQDLVRLYIGRAEPWGKKDRETGEKRSRSDLYDNFEKICMDEEAFREELRRYEELGGVTPRQVPPLIQNSHPELTPTNSTKMWNAKIISKNFGGSYTTRSRVSFEKNVISENKRLIEKMLENKGVHDLKVKTAEGKDVAAKAWEVSTDEMIAMLTGYRWAKEHAETLLSLEISYLKNENKGSTKIDPEIDDWVVVAPMLKRRTNMTIIANEEISIISRSIKETGNVSEFSDPAHRKAAESISLNNRSLISDSNSEFDAMIRQRRGVALLYAIDIENLEDGGHRPLDVPLWSFLLFYPNNSTHKKKFFTTKREETEEAAAVGKNFKE